MRSDRPASAVTRARPDGATPVVGVLCCNRLLDGRRVQSVASRFIEPLAAFGGLSALLVPALPDAVDAARLGGLLDGLLLTGSCSNLNAARYGGTADDSANDDSRDETALRLAGAMIEAGRPVFGICRGLQELNVLFGGSLADCEGHYRHGSEEDLAALFGHSHGVHATRGGIVAGLLDDAGGRVNSIHRQGIDRLGGGLTIEARAPDGLVEAVSAPSSGAAVLGVQWHPEWDVGSNPASRAFFELFGRAARGAALS